MHYDEEQAIDGRDFVRELQSVLRKYGWELKQLDQLGVQKEIVRRLLWSLQHPHIFLLLNKSEMNRLITLLSLNEEDIERLQTAMLTTAEDRKRLDRQEQVDTKAGGVRGLGAKRGEPGSVEDTALDRVLAPAYDLISRGRLAQHNSDCATNTAIERLKQTRVAYDYFIAAIRKLEGMPGDIRRTPEWEQWRQIVARDLAMVGSL